MPPQTDTPVEVSKEPLLGAHYEPLDTSLQASPLEADRDQFVAGHDGRRLSRPVTAHAQ